MEAPWHKREPKEAYRTPMAYIKAPGYIREALGTHLSEGKEGGGTSWRGV
jgi:hypothetical protein